MKSPTTLSGLLILTLLGVLPHQARANEPAEALAQPHGASSMIEEDASSWYRLAGIYQYLHFDFLGSADAVTYTFEVENQLSFQSFNVENRLILDYSDYPVEIEDFAGNPFPINGAGSGVGDLLVGTFLSPKNQGPHFNWGFGPLLQAPTASDDQVGTGKWTLGPGVHLQWHKERVSAGMFLWNSWSIAGESDRKNVNQMTMKPYAIYQLTDKWSALYIPLGISASWDKPSGDRWKIPLGGGLGRKLHVGDQEMEFQTQAFYTAVRPEKAPEWSLRFTLEIPF